MSSHQRKQRPAPAQRNAAASGGWRPPLWVFVLGGIALAVSLLIFSLGNGTQPTGQAPSREEVAGLVGRWVRPDGGYVLDIRGVAADGTLDVGYFNPMPIKVARGEVARDGDAIRVFIELRDVNYPGSTYRLRYDPEGRHLAGEYVQPLSGQRFDVAFVRE